MCNTFNLELKKWCWRSFGFVSVLVLGMCYIGSVQADVCFLPSGNCLSDTNLAAPQNYGGEDCSTYIATYRQQHLEYAADCVTCGGREYCKCGSDRRLVGNQCLCQDSDKIIQGGSCTACPIGKEPATATTCQCKSIYNYSPVANETCTEWCEDDAAATGQRGSADANIVQGTYAANSQSSAESRELNFDFDDEGTSYTAGNRLYKKSSCSCNSGYEYVGALCLPICDSTKGLTRSGTECVCSDSKKEWSNTENKCVCKTEYDPDGNGGCLTPGCSNPHQVRVNGECKCDEDNGYYDSLSICLTHLPSTQAYNLNWWDLLQQKATNAVYEVAQCLMPVKAAYAEQVVNTLDGTENYNVGTEGLEYALPTYGGGTGGSSTQQTTSNLSEDLCPPGCRSCMTGTRSCGNLDCSRCPEVANLDFDGTDNSHPGTAVDLDIDPHYPLTIDEDLVLPTVSYSCESDTAGTCWSVQKQCDNNQYAYNDEGECNTATHSSCIQDSDGCWHKKNRWLILDGDPDHSGYLPQVFVDGVEVNNGQSTGWWLGQKIYEGSRVIVKVNKTECSEDTCNGKFKRFWIEGETFPVDQTVIGFTLDDTFVQEHNRTWNDSYLYIDLEYYTDADYGDECTFVSINRDSDAAEVIDYSRSSGILWPDSRCNVTAYLWRYNGTYYCMYSPDGNEPAGDLYVKNSYWYSDDTCNGNGRYWNLSSRGYVMY